MTEWLARVPLGVRGWGVIAAAALAGIVAYAVVYGVAGRAARRRPGIRFLDGSLLRHSRGSLRVLLPLLAMRVALRSADAHLPADAMQPLAAALNFGIVVAATWLGIQLTRVMEDVAGRRFALDAEDNLHARRMHTRVALLRRVFVVGIGIVGLGMILLQMPGFRNLGAGLLASAGVLGVIVGVAAQRPIANLLAGCRSPSRSPFAWKTP